MRRVVSIIDLIPTIVDVPDDFICCSVSGEYRPPEEFRNEGKTHQTRTNCLWTCNLPSGQMAVLKEKTKEIWKGSLFKSLQKQLNNEWEAKFNSMTALEMIEILTELIKTEGKDVRVCMTQDGYYANGKFGWLTEDPAPIATTAECKVFSIGHSSQNY